MFALLSADDLFQTRLLGCVPSCSYGSSHGYGAWHDYISETASLSRTVGRVKVQASKPEVEEARFLRARLDGLEKAIIALLLF